jgi:hypothetical protein
LIFSFTLPLLIQNVIGFFYPAFLICSGKR